MDVGAALEWIGRRRARRGRRNGLGRAAVLGATLALAACAGRDTAPPPDALGPPMTVERLGALLEETGEGVEEFRPGAWQMTFFGVPVACITSPEHNRMRILAPVAPVDPRDAASLGRMLEANFHTTLDARYAVSEGNVYALFLHPLSTLTDRSVQSALLQVVSLVRTFGGDYSSGLLQYGTPGAPEE